MLRLGTALVCALLPFIALAQAPWTTQGIRIRDEGTGKGYAKQVDCVGTGATCTTNGEVWTLDITGGLGGVTAWPTCTGTQKLTYTGTNLICSADVDTTDLTIPTYTRATVPNCNSTWVSHEIRVSDGGQEDQTWVCLIDASYTYRWTIYSQAPDTTVAGTMANGTQFVTVGGTWTSTPDDPSTGYCTNALATATLGAATSGACQQHTVGANNVCDYSRTSQWMTVGATAKFNKVHISHGGSAPLHFGLNGGGSKTCTTFNGGIDVCQVDVPYDVKTLSRFAPVPHGASLYASVDWTGWEHRCEASLAGVPICLSTALNHGGTLTLPVAVLSDAAWVKGWDTADADGMAAPAGITHADYYWMTIGLKEVAWLTGSGAVNCFGGTTGDYSPEGASAQVITWTVTGVE